MREGADAQILGSIAANVRRHRERRELTQEALAEAAGLEVRAVQRIEQGRINFGVVWLVALARALDVSPGLLLRTAALERRAPGRPSTKARAVRHLR